MLISYNRPSIAWAISGTGASFVTSSSALTNGRPADPTRITWLSNPSPAITDYVTLTGTLTPSLAAPRCAGFLLPNISTAVPAGVKIVVTAKLSGGSVPLNGNSAIQRTQLLPNGAAASWFLFPFTTGAIDTIIFQIYNDLNGATWAAASQYVDLGELWIGDAAEFPLVQDAVVEVQGGLLQRQSHNNQAWPLMVQPFRMLTANLVPMTEAIAIGPWPYGSPTADDFQTVCDAISTQLASVLIPLYVTLGSITLNVPTINGSTIDVQRLHRSAQLGVINSPVKLQGNNNTYFTSPIVHGETPP